jgi:hypothetical protein
MIHDKDFPMQHHTCNRQNPKRRHFLKRKRSNAPQLGIAGFARRITRGHALTANDPARCRAVEQVKPFAAYLPTFSW